MTDKGLLIVLIGLPCSGKSFFGEKLQNYLSQQGVNVMLKNIGNYRREVQQFDSQKMIEFFKNFENEKNQNEWESFAQLCLSQCIEYLTQGQNRVAIFDGTNSCLQRREMIQDQSKGKSFEVLWIDFWVEDKQLLNKYIKENKIYNDDYKSSEMSSEERYKDFQRRYQDYKKKYQEVQSNEISQYGVQYAQITDFGREKKTELLKEETIYGRTIKKFIVNHYQKE